MDQKFIFRDMKENPENLLHIKFLNGEPSAKVLPQFKVKYGPVPRKDLEVTDPKGTTYMPCPTIGMDAENKNFLAIRNKKTNKVRLVEVDSVPLINAIFLKTQPDESESTNLGKKKPLSPDKLFAGKKAVRRLEQKEKLKVDPTLVQDTLKASITAVNVSDVTNVSSTLEDESMELFIPRCNRKASDVTKVYQLSDIITEEELDSIYDEAQSVSQDDMEKYSTLFKICYGKLMLTEPDNMEKISCLLYMDSILKFVKISARDLNKKSTWLCSYSLIIHNKIQEEFCVRTEKSLTRPFTMRDKAICYALTIGLLCCNFQVDMKALSFDTGLGLTRIAQLGRAVGVVPITKGSTVYILKLPLPPLPTVRKAKGRK